MIEGCGVYKFVAFKVWVWGGVGDWCLWCVWVRLGYVILWYQGGVYMYAACEVWVVWAGWSQILGGSSIPHWSSGPSRHLAGLEIPGPQSIQNHTLVNLDFCLRRTVTALPLKYHLNISSCRWYLKEKPICIRPRKAPWISKKLRSSSLLYLCLVWNFLRNESFC